MLRRLPGGEAEGWKRKERQGSSRKFDASRMFWVDRRCRIGVFANYPAAPLLEAHRAEGFRLAATETRRGTRGPHPGCEWSVHTGTVMVGPRCLEASPAGALSSLSQVSVAGIR